MEFLKVVWNHPLAPVGGAVLGAVVVQLWRQYLQRMVTVRWSVTHTTLAAGGDNPTWGRVDILHNGIPAGNLLQWCRVEIENESGSRNLSNVVVSLQYDQPEPVILSGGGSLEGSNQWFSWTPSFTAEVERYFAIPVADRPTTTDLSRRQDFVIPVLNRGAKAIFLFLVRPNVSNPALRIYCDHLNVLLKHRPERPMIFGGSSTRQLDRTGRWIPGHRGPCDESHEYLGCRVRGATSGLVRATLRCCCDPRVATACAGDRMSVVFG